MKTFEKIYEAVAKIPHGRVATYKQIAQITGVKNARIVGFAMRCNKDTKKVPCHRVVSSSGKLIGYAFGGVNQKKTLLEQEGVPFLNEETVDLTQSQYVPEQTISGV